MFGIIGGTRAGTGVWPWHIGVYLLKNGLFGYYTCGGTLVNNQFILTAAHCLFIKDTANNNKSIQ